MQIKSVKKDDLIPIIRNSKLIKEFDDDTIPIPKKFMLTEYKTIVTYKLVIDSDSTLYNILEKLRYYMVDDLPDEVYDYVLENSHLNFDNFKDFFFTSFNFLTQMSKSHIIYPKLDECVNTNNIGLVKYFIKKQQHFVPLNWTANSYCLAARYGNLQMIKFLHENGCTMEFNNDDNYDEDDGMSRIESRSFDPCLYALGSNFECLKYLHEIGFTLNKKVCTEAYKNNNLNNLKYIIENGVECPKDILKSHVKCDNFDCVEYLYNLGYALPANPCIDAAERNSIRYLKFAHELGFPITDSVMNNGIHKDSMECFSYALKHGAIIKDSTYYHAAYNGNIECLKFLHENNGKVQANLCSCAVFSGNINCLKYLHELDYALDMLIYDLCDECNLEMLKYILEYSVKLDFGCAEVLLEKIINMSYDFSVDKIDVHEIINFCDLLFDQCLCDDKKCNQKLCKKIITDKYKLEKDICKIPQPEIFNFLCKKLNLSDNTINLTEQARESIQSNHFLEQASRLARSNHF